MQLHAYRRTEAAPVELFARDYLFKPNSLGHVVCEVDDERAVERLLSISEAYREYMGDGVPAVAPAPAPAPAAATAPAAPPGGGDDGEGEGEGEGDKVFDEVLLGSEALPQVFDVLGATLTQAQVIELAFARSGMNREEWNLNDEDDREALIEGEVVKQIQAAEQAAAAIAESEAAAAAAAGEGEGAADPAATPLVITNDAGETLDLNTLSEPKLREFAKAQGITLPGGKSTKVAVLRQMVADGLAKAE
ncbi:hypothetical protein [Variovorax sp. dw_954]|uniref:hypothetical protein n=1 Tax=Variovorax sp. dw_954 TaxID=2720078 RepID=UPI001BD588A0|nr:hypothetical protein [Variovorax sp. dw_954]